MADYTYPSTSLTFGERDLLTPGDADKAIKGSQFDPEFEAIETAIASKADAASPTFTGTVTFADIEITGTATLATVDINAGTIDGAVIGGTTAAAGTFTNLTATGTITFTGATVADGGTVTTVDINGGSIDGAAIGANSASTGAFTNITATGTVVATGNVTGANLNVADWDTAFGWGDWSTGVDKAFVDALGVDASELGGVVAANYLTTTSNVTNLGSGAATLDLVVASDGAGGLKFESFPPGSGGTSGAELTADGTVAIGDPVILNSDGTVTVAGNVAGSIGGANGGLGDGGTFSSAIQSLDVAYDSINQQLLIVGEEITGSDIEVVSIDISGPNASDFVHGSTASCGFQPVNDMDWGVSLDETSGDFLVHARRNTDNRIFTCPGTLSSTGTISLGSPVAQLEENFSGGDCRYVPAWNRHVYITRDTNAAGNPIKIVLLETNGTSAFTKHDTLTLTGVASQNVCFFGYDPVTEQLLAVTDLGKEYCLIAYDSGTDTLSQGTVLTSASVEAARSRYTTTYDTTANCFLVFEGSVVGDECVVRFLTVSGTTLTEENVQTLSFPAGLDGGALYYAFYNPALNQTTFTFVTGSGSRLRGLQFDLNASTFVLSSTFNAAIDDTFTLGFPRVAAHIPEQDVIFFGWENSADIDFVVTDEIGTISNVADFVGFASNGAVDGGTVTVSVANLVNNFQTGLTANQDYWIEDDGTLATADTGNPKAGTALDANSIQVGI